MACAWYSRKRTLREWIPTKVQVTQDVDDEGRKIFEAFYGMPLWHNTVNNSYFVSHLNRVFGAINDDDARTNAEFAVDEFNKNKKKENQPPLQFLKVVGAVRIPHLLIDTYYLITLQADDGSTEPRKFFAKRREEKWFLKEVELEFEQKKSLFLSKISSGLDFLNVKGKKQILELVSSDLRKLTQFKDPNELEFEEEGSFVLLLLKTEGCEPSQCQAMQRVVVDESKVNSSIPGPSSSSDRYNGFGFRHETLSAEEKACWPYFFSGSGL